MMLYFIGTFLLSTFITAGSLGAGRTRAVNRAFPHISVIAAAFAENDAK
jgi:hypothetical protein